MAVTTYDPATVDMSDFPSGGFAYDDPYVYPSHSNRIVSAKELAQLQAAFLRGYRLSNVNDRGLGARNGSLDGIGHEPYSQVLTKTDNFAIQSDMPSNMLILMNVSTTGKAVTLPNPRGVKTGWTVTVKKINSSVTNTVGINRKNTETIDGRSANDVLTAQYSFATYINDGANWNVVVANDYMEIKNASNVSFPATGVKGGDHTLSITPGEWDLSAGLLFNANGATVTDILGFIGTASGDNFTGLLGGDNTLYGSALPSASRSGGASVAAYRLAVSTTTPYYLKVYSTFSVATPVYNYRFSARRVR